MILTVIFIIQIAVVSFGGDFFNVYKWKGDS